MEKKLHRLYSFFPRYNNKWNTGYFEKFFSSIFFLPYDFFFFSSFLLLTILWGASERKKKKDRSFFFILFLVLLEEEYLRVDTGNIRNEMEISSGGGDKGEVPGDSYRLFPFSTGRKGKKETFLLDRRRYSTWITRITYDFAEFNSNFPGDRRFDLNPRRKFSRPFVHV